MKIRLLVSETHREAITEKLEKAGFQIDDEAPFLLSETQVHPVFLNVRDSRGERMRLATEDIIFMESYGHRVEVHTAQGTYQAADRLYQLAETLDREHFVRVSNSVIISKNHVRKIRPALSMKFVLTMDDGTLVDVTRSYYYAFKEFFGI